MEISNYLSTIENEFSRLRGRSSLLSPLDWTEAEKWETDGIPLHIVLGAMGDGFKQFAAQQRKGEINSIRYFIPIVNQKFAEWKESQVGKNHDEEKSDMKDECFKTYTDDHTDVLEHIAARLKKSDDLPEPLRSAVVKLRGDILTLLHDAPQKQLSTNAIETRLCKLRVEFELSLIVSVAEDERAAIIRETKIEYDKIHLTNEALTKVCIRRLYQKFNLPELTLFAF